MKYARYLLASCLLCLSIQAKAVDCSTVDTTSWSTDSIQCVFQEIFGDVKTMATNFVGQINVLEQHSAMVVNTVQDTLQFVDSIGVPFQSFLFADPQNPGTVRCDQGSPCSQFRTDLENFVLDMGALAPSFPQVASSGLGHGQLLAQLISVTPPFALFGPYQVLQRVPGWQNVPMELGYLHDAIGNSDVFSGVLPSVAKSEVAGKAAGAVSFDIPPLGTDAFCVVNLGGLALNFDEVQYNRIKVALDILKTGLNTTADYLPDEQTAVVAGEGASVPDTPKAVVETVPNVLDAILTAVDLYRSNLEVCAGIEKDVAERSKLVDYRNAAGVTKAYWEVEGVLAREKVLDPFRSNAAAVALMHGAHYFAAERNWAQAFKAICDAYAAIDSA